MNPIEELEGGVQGCITDCKGCHDVCLHTLNHCLNMGGRHAAQQHIRFLLDCIEITQLNVNFLLRGSGLHEVTCWACASVAEACARDCEHLAEGDLQMQACARECWACSVSCRELAGQDVFSESL
jgi:hypothetical protein